MIKEKGDHKNLIEKWKREQIDLLQRKAGRLGDLLEEKIG